jgi:hypothetical protein
MFEEQVKAGFRKPPRLSQSLFFIPEEPHVGQNDLPSPVPAITHQHRLWLHESDISSGLVQPSDEAHEFQHCAVELLEFIIVLRKVGATRGERVMKAHQATISGRVILAPRHRERATSTVAGGCPVRQSFHQRRLEVQDARIDNPDDSVAATTGKPIVGGV